MQNLKCVHIQSKRLEKHLNYNASRTHFRTESPTPMREKRIKMNVYSAAALNNEENVWEAHTDTIDEKGTIGSVHFLALFGI